MTDTIFAHGFDAYVCEGDTIRGQIDGFDVVARIERDDCTDRPDERDCGFWPVKVDYETEQAWAAEHVKAACTMAAWENDEWFYCGVCLTVEKAGVQLTSDYAAALWGVECNYPDSDNSYLTQVAEELVSEALDEARAKLAQLRA